MIMKKNLSAAPPILQRMLLRLQRYNFSLKYKPAKELVIAQTLSRAYTSDTDSKKEKDVRQHVLTVVEKIPRKSQLNPAGHRVSKLQPLEMKVYVRCKPLF